jgi:ferredoxin--NADP+ reductase
MATANVSMSNEIEQLRLELYNSRVVQIRRVHDDLMILRVRPDDGLPECQPGQYTVLGLGAWEPRIVGVQEAPSDLYQHDHLIKRAYSMSCSMLDDQGRLTRVADCSYLEFYITLVRRAEKHPPALTPRLFGLREGDRIFCGPHVHGHYGLHRIQSDDNIIFAATGTGEAPHNAMVAELLTAGHRGRIVSVTCVRWKRDLAYQETHRDLERKYSMYQYLARTTRESENIDSDAPNYVGKRYLQEYFAFGEFERDAELELSAGNTHVFLCGSPAMIGVPHHTHDPAKRYPSPTGMVEVLERRGFCVDQPHEAGDIHFEKYW